MSSRGTALVVVAAAAVLAAGCARPEQKESMSMSAASSARTAPDQPSLRDAPAETLLLLLPDRVAYPEGWNVSVTPSQEPPRSTGGSEPLPACADPYRALTRSGAVRALVLSKGYNGQRQQELSHSADDTPEELALEGKLPEIMVTYLRESDDVDLVNAYRDWAKHCPEGNTGPSGAKEKVTIIESPSASSDPSVTIRVTASHPALDPDGPETTTILTVARTRGLAVIAELQSGSDPAILAPVVQSALTKLRAA